MEKIFITYSPKGEQTASKVRESLKKAGFAATVGASRKDIEDASPEVCIAVITDDSCEDGSMRENLGTCAKNNINVVPFVTSQMPQNMLTDFFLDEHVWIDSYEQPIYTALGDLTDLLKRNYKELSKTATKKKDDFGKKTPQTKPTSKDTKKPTTTAQPSEKEKLYRNLFFISLAVVAVMLLILVNGGVNQVNREASNQQANYQNALGNSNLKIELSSDLKKSETALVGHWKMSDYVDNQFRATREDSISLQNLVNSLISRAELTFNADKTFTRIGFTEQPETGVWEYDPQSKYLKLQPTNVNQYDVVQIEDLTPTKLTLVVSERMDNNQVITKIIFTRVN